MQATGVYNVAEAEQRQHTRYENTMVCNVWMLDATCVAFALDVSFSNSIVCSNQSINLQKYCRGQVLLDLTFDYLSLLERDFFGLVFNAGQTQADAFMRWLDPTKKIRKQLSARQPVTLWFRVKFYVPDPICLQDEDTRYQMFLQVRKDILEGRLPLTKSKATQLAGLALQAELGDYSADDCRPGYISQFRFLQQQNPDFETQASEWHRKYSSMLPSAAELEYLNAARQLDRYGVRFQEAVVEKEVQHTVEVGASYSGISEFRSQKPTLLFPWDNILNIGFRGKKFTVNLKSPTVNILSQRGSQSVLARTPSTTSLATGDAQITAAASTYTYRLSSAMATKAFWQYAVACHAFFRIHEPTKNSTDTNVAMNRFSTRGPISTTSISATAVSSAISRVSSGFRRYFSFRLTGKSSAASEMSGPVGGVERTLSTVMELRRSSRLSSRSFSRSSGRRSMRRSQLNTNTTCTPFSQSTGLRTISNLSLTNDKPNETFPTNPTVRNYGQIPPSGSRYTPIDIGRHEVSNSQQESIKNPPLAVGVRSNPPVVNTTGIIHSTAIVNRTKRTPSPSGTESVVGHSRPSQAENTPASTNGWRNSISASGRVRPDDKAPNSKTWKPSSPVAHNTRGSIQRRQAPPSPNGRGDTTSTTRPRHRSVVDTRPRDRRVHPDLSRQTADLSATDQSDMEEADWNTEDASRYWNTRRTHAINRPQRAPSRSRDFSATRMHESYQGRPEGGFGRADANNNALSTSATWNARRQPSVELLAGAKSGSSSRLPGSGRATASRPQQLVPPKKTSEASVIPRSEPSTDRPHSNAWTKTSSLHIAPSPSTSFVRDPFHPGAPSGDRIESTIHPSLHSTPTSTNELTVATNTSTTPSPGNSEGLIRIRIRPDAHGRLGFNVRGGIDYATPVIVSRVGANMPADLCLPRLSEGDQLISINGKSVAEFTHEQVIAFIRTASQQSSEMLELLVKQSDYVTDEFNEDASVPDSGDAPPVPPRTSPLHRMTSVIHRPEQTNSSIRASRLSKPGRKSPTDPLCASMIELEQGLMDGSILNKFEQLPRRKNGLTMNASRLHENILKNRYRDISPYDLTRVVLKQGSSDYINASFVSMELAKTGVAVNYIATQGPLPSTYGDFWQMCWEQRVRVVVMLTAISERGRVKCHQYWPDLGQSLSFTVSSNIGTNSMKSSLVTGPRSQTELQVQTTREEITGDFAFREFTVTQRSPGAVRPGVSTLTRLPEVRRITQLQFISWPDHGVPNNPNDLITFVEKVRERRAQDAAPIVVHCSAGIGRTGVLITMETAVRLMELGQLIRPLDLVQHMRAQRALLIQTTEITMDD